MCTADLACQLENSLPTRVGQSFDLGLVFVDGVNTSFQHLAMQVKTSGLDRRLLAAIRERHRSSNK